MELRNCRGLPVFCRANIPSGRYEAAMDYEPKDGDVIVSTYPKAGTTWMQYIVWQILHKAESYPSFDDALHRVMPYMEYVGVEVIDKVPPPRFYKTHLPYNFMKISAKAKYIYVHRNPGDVVTSYYHFYNDMRDTTEQKFIEMNEFFDIFVSGEIAYGDFFDHVLSFYKHKDDENVLFVSYEDLKKDTETQILKIAQFLGEDYHRSLTEDQSLLKKVMEVTSFDYMKKHLKVSRPPKQDETKLSVDSTEAQNEEKPTKFFRKGVVGDCNSFLTNEQRKVLLDKISNKMEGTELLELWQSVIKS